MLFLNYLTVEAIFWKNEYFILKYALDAKRRTADVLVSLTELH